MRLAMVFLACSLFACGDDDAALPDAGTDAGGRDAATPDAIVDGPDLGEPDLGVDAGPPDPCADGVGICEDFEGYPELSALADGDRFGDRIEKVLLDREQNIEIDDEFDFWLAEQVIRRRDG